jgi:SAM-dependent methyltransferase
MGFDLATIQFLARSRDLGISLDRVLTLGRQWLYVKPHELRRVLAHNGIALGDDETGRLFSEDGYCEPLMKLLGARHIDSMDVSPYEKATIIHDLNQPWPLELRDRFSLLVDAGTLEHVFNFPVAIRNCMEAVAPGGHFLTITPANNLLGHGFYQFSPELFFRIFSPENGFEIAKILLYEQPFDSTWYQVSDPREVRSRVELTNSRPAYLIVCAKKIASIDVFAQPPLQSDYPLIYWQKDAGGTTEPAKSLLKRWTPGWLADRYRRLRPFNPRYFKKERS